MPPPYLPLQQGHFIRKVGDDQLFAKNTGKQVAACGTHGCQHAAQQKSQPWPEQGTSQDILQREQPQTWEHPAASRGLSWSSFPFSACHSPKPVNENGDCKPCLGLLGFTRSGPRAQWALTGYRGDCVQALPGCGEGYRYPESLGHQMKGNEAHKLILLYRP